MKTYMGIDIGTSSVKLMLVDELGQVINTVKESYPLFYPKPGWSEQNPEDWYQKTLEGMKKLLHLDIQHELQAIGFAGQMHGLVILDADDQVIRPAILWNDGRTQEETDELNQNKSLLLDEVSNIAFSGFTAPKLLWLKKHEPENFAKINKIMLPKDYVIYKMTGVHSTDISDASGMLLFDIKKRDWNQKLIDICGIKREMLPKIFDSKEIVGPLKQEITNELQIITPILCVAGASDNAAAAIGNGVVNHGDCNLSLGTSGTLFVPLDKPISQVNEAIHQFSYVEQRTHLMGVILSAASCNQWWIETILQTHDYQEELKDLEPLLGKNQLFFLPYLMGERSPHNDANAKSLFIGMTPSTTRKHMTLSILEGIAFAFRDNLEAFKSMGINIKKSRICGGGAQVAVLKTIISAVLNLPLETLVLDDGAAYGASLLALSAISNTSLLDLTHQVIKVKETTYPDPLLVKSYDEKYQTYKKLYPALKDIYKTL